MTLDCITRQVGFHLGTSIDLVISEVQIFTMSKYAMTNGLLYCFSACLFVFLFQAGKNYMLREFSTRESKIAELKVSYTR